MIKLLAKLARRAGYMITRGCSPMVIARPAAFDHSTVLAIHALAIDLGLAEPARRALLLDDPLLTARLTRPELDASAQLLADLKALNGLRDVPGQPTQLLRWLRTAAALAAHDCRSGQFAQWSARLDGSTP